MFWWKLFVANALVLVTVLVATPSNGLPIDALKPRASRNVCADGLPEPCVCGNSRSIRDKNVQSNCPNFSFVFRDPHSPTDGSLMLVNGNLGAVECDHIVELQFIARQINTSPTICRAFAGNLRAFDSFFAFINGGSNVIFVDTTVNNAKGVLIGDKQFDKTTVKAVNGVINYLTHLQQNPRYPNIAFATDIAVELARLIGPQNGFSASFARDYDQLVTSAIASAQTQLFSRPTAATPGDPFIHLFPANFQRRRSQPVTGTIIDAISEFVNGTNTLPTPAPLGPLPTLTNAVSATNAVSSTTGPSNATATSALVTSPAKLNNTSTAAVSSGTASSTLSTVLSSAKANSTLASTASSTTASSILTAALSSATTSSTATTSSIATLSSLATSSTRATSSTIATSAAPSSVQGSTASTPTTSTTSTSETSAIPPKGTMAAPKVTTTPPKVPSPPPKTPKTVPKIHLRF